jgi:hypothetical protein
MVRDYVGIKEKRLGPEKSIGLVLVALSLRPV